MTPDLRTQSGPHVFVSDLELLDLDQHDRHHLARSLRLRHGDPLTVSDADGSWRTAAFGAELEATGPIHHVEPPSYELGLGIALTKSTKPDFAVQKATEIGIDTIVLFPSEHSVARWDETKRARNEQRLSKVAREASMQSRRVRIPRVEIAESMNEIVAHHAVARADFGGIAANSDHRFLLIGPEGGWSVAERTLVPESVDLGSTVLRAETAAVVAAAFMAATRSSARPRSD